MPKGLTVTLKVNWLIKPFTMLGIAWLFFYVIFKAFIPIVTFLLDVSGIAIPWNTLLLSIILFVVILRNPFNILLIAIPLILQTFLIFFISYGWSYKWKLPHDIAAPESMIGASNFFELSVAVAVVLFSLDSGATLTTVVGVLVEVPVMLTLVIFANKTRNKF